MERRSSAYAEGNQFITRNIELLQETDGSFKTAGCDWKTGSNTIETGTGSDEKSKWFSGKVFIREVKQYLQQLIAEELVIIGIVVLGQVYTISLSCLTWR